MRGRQFLDTNIFVYTFDGRTAARQARAKELVQRSLRERTGIVSFQVVQEFVNVATTKFTTPLSGPDCALYLNKVLFPLCEIHSSNSLYAEALDIQERWQFSFFDSLIVAAALAAGCRTLWSEDFRNDQKVRELTIRNPFRPLE
ncbi:MAG: PIN domain-containing protein [Acidobacteriota bacterium]